MLVVFYALRVLALSSCGAGTLVEINVLYRLSCSEKSAHTIFILI